MQSLEDALETNRRLNRRLGSMEHELHALVSKAQHETGQALDRAASAQRMAHDANAAWYRSMDRGNGTDRAAAIFLLLFGATLIWAVVATIIAIV